MRKNMDRINTIIFDIGNVLVKFRWAEYLKDCGYSKELAERVANATVKNKFWKEWDRGGMEDSALIDQFCKLDVSIEMEIKKLFEDFDQLIKEYDYSAELIQKLKQEGYKVYLLSNYSKNHFELSKNKFQFIKHVDGGVISYEIKHIKPEPEIYEALIKKYNINPSEAVFLDDLSENLEGAKQFGLHTIQVKSYDQMLMDLRKIGVNI
jgi:putative hydrolase of the HAD superfamily